MLANQDIAVIGERVVLVPYRPEHVAQYHEWMASPELQELTASEPLTLEEEYDMQEKWRVDEDKLTFIIHAREPDSHFALTPGAMLQLPMVGDVNLFLKGNPCEKDFEVEIEIMIAEPAYRRKGYAKEALYLLLSYATQPTVIPPNIPEPSLRRPPLPLSRERLVVRIGASNGPSISLFKSLGFDITKRVEVFHEVEMRLRGIDGVENAPAPGSDWRVGRVEEIVFG